MAVAFTRQLGYESGVQLNPVQDRTDGFAPDNSDQMFAIAARLSRGRIDKPFAVDRSTFTRLLGKGESIRASRLNEAQAHIYAALREGAYQAIVYRLHTSSAALNYVIVKETDDRTGLTFEVAQGIPENEQFLFAIKHLECFNDGIKVQIHAESVKEDGEQVDNPFVSLRILDASGQRLFVFSGSLNDSAIDDFGNSAYLPDVIDAQTDMLEVTTGGVATISKDSAAYGLNANETDKVITSGVLMYFTEGGTGYSQEDYAKARAALKETHYDYAYISSGGSQSIAFLNEMLGLAYDTDRQLRADIDGTLTPYAAIAFTEQFSFPEEASHLAHWFWKPIINNDPMGLSPRYVMGASTLNIALACKRNAVKDSRGFARKNYAIAGKYWPVPLTGMEQIYFPTDQEFSALAKAKINPVVHEVFNGGGRFVFKDQLTAAKTEVSYRKLISVVERLTDLDNSVSRYAAEIKQLPMEDAMQRMRDFMQVLFEGAASAKWLIPSSELDGMPFAYTVTPSRQSQADTIMVEYSLSCDGAARKFHLTPILVRPTYS